MSYYQEPVQSQPYLQYRDPVQHQPYNAPTSPYQASNPYDRATYPAQQPQYDEYYARQQQARPHNTYEQYRQPDQRVSGYQWPSQQQQQPQPQPQPPQSSYSYSPYNSQPMSPPQAQAAPSRPTPYQQYPPPTAVAQHAGAPAAPMHHQRSLPQPSMRAAPPSSFVAPASPQLPPQARYQGQSSPYVPSQTPNIATPGPQQQSRRPLPTPGSGAASPLHVGATSPAVIPIPPPIFPPQAIAKPGLPMSFDAVQHRPPLSPSRSLPPSQLSREVTLPTSVSLPTERSSAVVSSPTKQSAPLSMRPGNDDPQTPRAKVPELPSAQPAPAVPSSSPPKQSLALRLARMSLDEDRPSPPRPSLSRSMSTDTEGPARLGAGTPLLPRASQSPPAVIKQANGKFGLAALREARAAGRQTPSEDPQPRFAPAKTASAVSTSGDHRNGKAEPPKSPAPSTPRGTMGVFGSAIPPPEPIRGFPPPPPHPQRRPTLPEVVPLRDVPPGPPPMHPRRTTPPSPIKTMKEIMQVPEESRPEPAPKAQQKPALEQKESSVRLPNGVALDASVLRALGRADGGGPPAPPPRRGPQVSASVSSANYADSPPASPTKRPLPTPTSSFVSSPSGFSSANTRPSTVDPARRTDSASNQSTDMRGSTSQSLSSSTHSSHRKPVEPTNSVPTINVPQNIPTINLPGDIPTISFPDEEESEQSRSAPPPPQISITSSPSINITSFTGPDFSPTSSGGPATPGGRQRGSGLICAGCGGGITGRIVSAMDKRWHPACFKCEKCDELLEHVSSFEHDGRAYCHLDYHEHFAPRCYHCQTPIADSQFITLDDPSLAGGLRTYHELHFFCAECGDPFLDPSRACGAPKQGGAAEDEDEEVGFTIWKGHPYCEVCHIRLHLPKCKGCRKSIREADEAVEVRRGKWHWACFVCDSCEQPFADGTFFERQDKAFCEGCYRILLRNEL